MSQLLPHQQRVIVEAQELETKMKALLDFMHNPKFMEVDVAERGRLHEQSHHMGMYLNVLKDRIANFNKTEQQAVADAARKGFNDRG